MRTPGADPWHYRETSMKKKTVKKLMLAKETVAALLPQVAGGITAACTPTWNCGPTNLDCQSGKYPC